MTSLRTANKHRARRDLWRWWRPRFDAGDFNAFLMSLDWKGPSYFRTPKDPKFWGFAIPTGSGRGRA